LGRCPSEGSRYAAKGKNDYGALTGSAKDYNETDRSRRDRHGKKAYVERLIGTVRREWHRPATDLW
jgi:hypothetical protein